MRQEPPWADCVASAPVTHFCVIEVSKTSFACDQCVARRESGLGAKTSCKVCKKEAEERRRDGVITEVIELAAVVVHAMGNIVAEFPLTERIVRPQNLPLSQYCSLVTGLSTEMVQQHGRPLEQVLARLAQWLSNIAGNVDNVVHVTVGDFVLERLLPQQCKASGFTLPCHMQRHINLKHVYDTCTGQKATTLKAMAANLGVATLTSDAAESTCRAAVDVLLHLGSYHIPMHQLCQFQVFMKNVEL